MSSGMKGCSGLCLSPKWRCGWRGRIGRSKTERHERPTVAWTYAEPVSVAAAIAMCGLAHMVGDYVIQSHWMANAKTSQWWPAVLHGISYGLPFLLITRSVLALAVIVGTHIVIDHWRLARYLVWLRNQFAPRAWRPPLASPTGTPDTAPDWLAVWLLFIADNVVHVAINVGAVVWL